MRQVGIYLVLKWQDFGYELGLPEHTIRRIQAEYERQSSAYAFPRAVFQEWSQHCVYHPHLFTWAEIIRALESPMVRESDCARRLQTFLLNRYNS